MEKVKKSALVVAAEDAVIAKAQELKAAEEVVAQLKQEHTGAIVARLKAREDDDAKLPQCTMVSVARNGSATVIGKMVILRQTPTKMLIVRRVGEYEYEWKFKFESGLGRFVRAEKRSYYSHTTTELRDVPAQFMP